MGGMNLTFCHVKGKDNQTPDSLTRPPFILLISVSEDVSRRIKRLLKRLKNQPKNKIVLNTMAMHNLINIFNEYFGYVNAFKTYKTILVYFYHEHLLDICKKIILKCMKCQKIYNFKTSPVKP